MVAMDLGLDVHRLCGAIEEIIIVSFLPHWLRAGSQSMISQRKIPLNTLPRQEIEPGRQRGQAVRYNHFPTKLS